MDQSSGKGWRLRRILPFALGSVGLCAVIAYGSAVLGTPAHLVAQRVAPAHPVISPADPLPGASAQVQVPGQLPIRSAIGQAPGDAARATRNLDNATTTAPAGITPAGGAPGGPAPASSTTTTSTTPRQQSPICNLTDGVPVVDTLNLPVLVAGSDCGAHPGSSTALPVSPRNIAGLGGLTLPSVNGATVGGLLGGLTP